MDDPKHKVMPPTIRQLGDPRRSDATWTLISQAPPGTCSQCGRDHNPEEPHDAQALLYQYQFNAEHSVWPTWGDAMVHCAEDVQEVWRDALRNRGVPEDQLTPRGPTDD